MIYKDTNSPPHCLAKYIVIREQNVHQDNEEIILYDWLHYKTSSGLNKTIKRANCYSFPAFTRITIAILNYLLGPSLLSKVTNVTLATTSPGLSPLFKMTGVLRPDRGRECWREFENRLGEGPGGEVDVIEHS